MSKNYFDGANLVEPVGFEDNPLRTTDVMRLEEFLADRDGGDPVDYIADAEIIRAQLAIMACASEEGEHMAVINPTPLPDGHMFAGYHELRVMGFDPQDQPVIRTLYCSSEQYERGEFDIPDEGIFAIDLVDDVKD